MITKTEEALIGEAYKLEESDKNLNYVKEEVKDYSKIKVAAVQTQLKIDSIKLN